MATTKGTLKKAKKGFMVTVPTKKGTADLPIPDLAQWFRLADADEGAEVLVERDQQNRIVKVTIPGKPEVSPQGSAPKHDNRRGRGKQRGGGHRRDQTGGGDRRGPSQAGPRPGPSGPIAVRGLSKASPSLLGSPFHNPYTFLPFSDKKPTRREPTPHSIDEDQRASDRFTGVLELEITTRSPVLTCHPHGSEKNGHRTYEALTIGDDVIVPATGIRGALRTLLTIITGGTLGYMNEYAYLCQGRDAKLGPRGLSGPGTVPVKPILAEVVRPGTANRPGIVQLGETDLIRAEEIKQALEQNRKVIGKCRNYNTKQDPLPRTIKPGGRQSIFHLWIQRNTDGQITEISDSPKPLQNPWKLKLSGRPVGGWKLLERKREGAFRGNGKRIELPAELWAAYSGRNAHGDRPELRAGDLIWLEPKNTEAESIENAADVQSIQWARWGKRGQALKDRIPKEIWPDHMQADAQVDEVTDLFGQVASKREQMDQVLNFAARIRPENLVFLNAKSKLEKQVTLAPLAPPHAGCMAFYRDNDNGDDVGEDDALRGYKVYRTSDERGADAPWLYTEQGVYDDQGKLKQEPQKVNKTCDLVPEGLSGLLRISFRALSKRELALLLQACELPWRIGGGKPLGLGLCTVRPTAIIDEFGQELKVPDWNIGTADGQFIIDGWGKEIGEELKARAEMWRASQAPVSKLRYPRAVNRTKSKWGIKNSRGGHIWFQRHAAPRMVSAGEDGKREPGIAPFYIDGELKAAAEETKQPLDETYPMIAGQILPFFDPVNPLDDVLYGYDCLITQSDKLAC